MNPTSAENFPPRSVDSRIKTSFDGVNVVAVDRRKILTPYGPGQAPGGTASITKSHLEILL